MRITNDRMRHHRVPAVLRHTPDLIGEEPVLTRNIYSSILCSLAEERDCISPVKVFCSNRAKIYESVWTVPVCSMVEKKSDHSSKFAS